jgi:hypothetical protein
MRKPIAAAVVLLLGLTGCSCLRTLTGASPFDPKNPKVYVVESKERSRKAVVVDQDPVYFFREHGPKIQIRWQLQTPGYRFDTKLGITSIKPYYGPPDQVHSCQVDPESKDQRTFVCVNENTAPGLYKYTIHVVATDGSSDPRPLDPMVGND